MVGSFKPVSAFDMGGPFESVVSFDLVGLFHIVCTFEPVVSFDMVGPFKSHFLRISRIERHSEKIEFFFILPKNPFG